MYAFSKAERFVTERSTNSQERVLFFLTSPPPPPLATFDNGDVCKGLCKGLANYGVMPRVRN